MTIADDSNVTISNKAVVTGVLNGTNCTVNGYVDLAGSASVNGKFSGDLRISESFTLNSNISTAGNLYIDSTLKLDTFEFNIDGDVTQDSSLYINTGKLNCKGNYSCSSYLNLGSGQLICDGNFNVENRYGRIFMENGSSEIHVGGNFTFDGGYDYSSLTAGKLFVSGDCNVYRSTFNTGKNYEIIFNGDKKQIINVTNASAKLSNIIIENKSEIEITKVFNYDSFTNVNDAKITFTNGGSVGTVLQGNLETDENYVLVMGDLDLNGKTLTINGDFIQSGGNVILNGGHLIINGDYLIQTKNEDGTFTYSTGTLNMTNKSDKVDVAGNFVMGSTKSHKDSLTNGTLTVGGDFSQLDVGLNSASNFSASGNHTTKIKGKTKQSIKFDNPTQSSFLNISFENAAGISLDTNVYAYGKVKDEYKSVNGSYLYH